MCFFVPKFHFVDGTARTGQVDSPRLAARWNLIAQCESFLLAIPINDHDMVELNCAAAYAQLNGTISLSIVDLDLAMVCATVHMCVTKVFPLAVLRAGSSANSDNHQQHQNSD